MKTEDMRSVIRVCGPGMEKFALLTFGEMRCSILQESNLQGEPAFSPGFSDAH